MPFPSALRPLMCRIERKDTRDEGGEDHPIHGLSEEGSVLALRAKPRRLDLPATLGIDEHEARFRSFGEPRRRQTDDLRGSAREHIADATVRQAVPLDE